MKNRKRFASIALILALPLAVGAASNDLSDLQDLDAGAIVSELNDVLVFGFNPSMGAGTNACIVFDSANPPGIDYDLGTPNENFGGPGEGDGGEVTNDTALGNILIIAEDLDDNDGDDLVDVPNDADLKGAYFEFDFSSLGNGNKKTTVTVDSVTLMDIEREEGEDGTFLELSGPDLPLNLIQIPPTGDNGVVTISGIGLAGVDLLVVQMNGSGAVVAVTYNTEADSDCWFTFGGFQNAGIQSGGKDFTFGGNVGPPSSGAMEVVDHNTGDNFHTNDVEITSCVVSGSTGPQQPGGKKGFKIDKAFFKGTGRLNGVKGYPFIGYVIDAGEPAGKKNNDKDYFNIVVRHPDTNAVVFEADGELDGGNVQLHPPVGN
ncbi:MAG: hypothetical protein ACYTGZ_06515 [Planctomycetota bacterium]